MSHGTPEGTDRLRGRQSPVLVKMEQVTFPTFFLFLVLAFPCVTSGVSDPGELNRSAPLVDETLDPVSQGQAVMRNFYGRYNSSQQVDLVFVLDRSGSVPKQGWVSMLNFVRDILEHFTVDSDNTRVAIVTFSTEATVDINDLAPSVQSDLENKCTLNQRISQRVEGLTPQGYTATAAALGKAYDILLNSRPQAKKAILVVTDGRSNIGPPPVRKAIDILSLRWEGWDMETHGPQVEMYAFGMVNACLPELQSIASPLPNHVFLIPNFNTFVEFARSLHGGQL